MASLLGVSPAERHQNLCRAHLGGHRRRCLLNRGKIRHIAAIETRVVSCRDQIFDNSFAAVAVNIHHRDVITVGGQASRRGLSESA